MCGHILDAEESVAKACCHSTPRIAPPYCATLSASSTGQNYPFSRLFFYIPDV